MALGKSPSRISGITFKLREMAASIEILSALAGFDKT
jgi:hypothetical protein